MRDAPPFMFLSAAALRFGSRLRAGGQCGWVAGTPTRSELASRPGVR